jgi:hypothetical protein
MNFRVTSQASYSPEYISHYTNTEKKPYLPYKLLNPLDPNQAQFLQDVYSAEQQQ